MTDPRTPADRPARRFFLDVLVESTALFFCTIAVCVPLGVISVLNVAPEKVVIALVLLSCLPIHWSVSRLVRRYSDR